MTSRRRARAPGTTRARNDLVRCGERERERLSIPRGQLHSATSDSISRRRRALLSRTSSAPPKERQYCRGLYCSPFPALKMHRKSRRGEKFRVLFPVGLASRGFCFAEFASTCVVADMGCGQVRANKARTDGRW